PVTDTIKVRLAGQYDAQDGFYDNISTTGVRGGRAPDHNRLSPDKGYMLRGTVLWNPTSQFDARLKINQVRDKVTEAGAFQLAVCPDGVGPVATPIGSIQFLNPNDDCKVNRTESLVDMVPSVYGGLPNHGTGYNES